MWMEARTRWSCRDSGPEEKRRRWEQIVQVSRWQPVSSGRDFLYVGAGLVHLVEQSQ